MVWKPQLLAKPATMAPTVLDGETAGRQRQEGEDSEAGLPFGTAVGGGQACLEV